MALPMQTYLRWRCRKVPVTSSNLIVATFTSSISSWICSDIGDTGANGNVFGGASTFSNSICTLRGDGSGIEGPMTDFIIFISHVKAKWS